MVGIDFVAERLVIGIEFVAGMWVFRKKFLGKFEVVERNFVVVETWKLEDWITLLVQEKEEDLIEKSLFGRAGNYCLLVSDEMGQMG